MVQLKSCILPSERMVQKEWRKLSQWFWKGLLKWYDGGGENGITSKTIFKVEVFFSQNIDFHFYLKRLLELFFFPLFFMLHLLRTRGFDDIWEENHFFKNLFLYGFNILAVDAYSGMELCMPTWLNRDYGDGGAVDILVVDAYSGVEVCTSIFLGEASKKILGSKSILNFFKTQMDTSLNKAQHKQELLYG
jgi:hypothetical protein